jgi:hypothetical protein
MVSIDPENTDIPKPDLVDLMLDQQHVTSKNLTLKLKGNIEKFEKLSFERLLLPVLNCTDFEAFEDVLNAILKRAFITFKDQIYIPSTSVEIQCSDYSFIISNDYFGFTTLETLFSTLTVENKKYLYEQLVDIQKKILTYEITGEDGYYNIYELSGFLIDYPFNISDLYYGLVQQNIELLFNKVISPLIYRDFIIQFVFPNKPEKYKTENEGETLIKTCAICSKYYFKIQKRSKTCSSKCSKESQANERARDKEKHNTERNKQRSYHTR